MKKTCLLLALLAALSAAALGTVHSSIHATSEQVVFRELPMAGDRSAADGLTVELNASIRDLLFWDTSFAPGPDQTETQARFQRPPLKPETILRSPHFFLYAPINFGASSNGSMFDEGDELWMEEAFRELDAETPMGKSASKEVLVSDYEEVYPNSVDLVLHHHSIHFDFFGDHYGGTNGAFTSQFLNAFRFPVLEGHRQEITLEKGLDGSMQLTCNDTASGVSIESVSCSSANYLYFVVNARSNQDGSLLDYSHTPGGYGLYRLPVDKEEMTLEDLEMIYPLDPSYTICQLRCTDDRHLLMLTTEQGQSFLRVLDLDRQQELQSVPLWTESKDAWPDLITDDDLVLVILGAQEQARLFRQNPDGLCELLQELQMSATEEYPRLLSEISSMDWDGQRLAILTRTVVPQAGPAYSSDYNASFSLLVFDRDGLQYLGSFLNSLNTEMGYNEDSRYRCRLTGDDPLTAHWSK